MFYLTDNDGGNDKVATPSVTITVKGVPVTGGTVPGSGGALESALHMVYAQAVKDDERRQWVVFPPRVEALGCEKDDPEQVLILARHQEFKGNRTKWHHARAYKTGLAETLAEFAGQGWTVGGIVAVPLEKDDYLAAWNDNDTPHKAMRAVSRQLEAAYGITVK